LIKTSGSVVSGVVDTIMIVVEAIVAVVVSLVKILFGWVSTVSQKPKRAQSCGACTCSTSQGGGSGCSSKDDCCHCTGTCSSSRFTQASSKASHQTD
jgi:hypothetical protein